jgi:hypothetical protein
MHFAHISFAYASYLKLGLNKYWPEPMRLTLAQDAQANNEI